MKALHLLMFSLIFGLLTQAVQAKSAATLELGKSDFGEISLQAFLEGWVAPDQEWSLEQSSIPSAASFRTMDSGGLEGLRWGTGWLRLQIVNSSEVSSKAFLTSRMIFPRLAVYKEQGGQLSLLADASAIQEANPFDDHLGSFAVPLVLDQGQNTFYLRFLYYMPRAKLRFELLDEKKFQDRLINDGLMRGVLLGIYVAIFFYISFLWLKLKKSRYGIYSIYVLSYIAWFAVTSFVVTNKTDWLWLRSHWTPVTEVLAESVLLLALWFTASFLDLKQYWNQVYRFFIGFAVFVLGLTIVSFFQYQSVFTVLRVCNLLTIAMILLVGLLVAWRGYRPAMFFTIGWSFPCIGAVFVVLELLELVDGSYLTTWAVHIGAALEMIVLLLALSDRFQHEQKQAKDEIDLLNVSLAKQNRELDQNYKDLQANEELRTQFFHNTSHELRTPLNGILGYLSMLQRGQLGTLSAEVREKINALHNLAQGLKLQINAILDLAQSRKGSLSIQFTEINLIEMKSTLQELAEGLCQKSKSVSFQAQLKLNEKGSTFVGDYEKVQTIVRNLLGNAIKFSDPLRPNHVELRIEHLSNQLLIEVRDTGIGIPAAMHEKVFEEFRQVSGENRRRYEGSGIGLSLVKALVQAMHGTIELESAEGVGTIFRVRLPEGDPKAIMDSKPMTVKEVKLPLSVDTEAPSSTFMLRDQLKDSRILIIDDHEENCEVLAAALQFHGAKTQCLNDPRDALSIIQKDRPDLILLDLMMPEMSGEDLLIVLRKDPMLMDIPVVMLTAIVDDKERLQMFSLGADDYLTKPVEDAELILRSRNLIQRLHQSRQLSGLLDREKILLLGEMLSEVSHDIQNVFQKIVDDEDIVYDFSYLLRTLAPNDSPLLRLTEQGIDFDPNHLDPSAPDLPDIPQELQRKPYLRLLRLYLTGFSLSKEQRHELWNDWLSWPAERQEALSATLQILSVYLSLQEQSQDMRRLLDAMLTLCQDTRAGSACEASQIVSHSLCLVDSLLKEKKAKAECQLQRLEWPMAAADMMQILLEVIHHLLEVFPAEQEDNGLIFRNGQDDTEMFMHVRRYGINWTSEKGHQLTLEHDGKHYAYEKFPQLVHAQRLARKVGGEIHFSIDDDGPCFEIRQRFERVAPQRRAA